MYLSRDNLYRIILAGERGNLEPTLLAELREEYRLIGELGAVLKPRHYEDD